MLFVNFLVCLIVVYLPLTLGKFSTTQQVRGSSIVRAGRGCSDSVLGNFAPKELTDYVNILGGTDSRYDVSHGSTLPLIARPWGFNAFAPQTDDDPTWPGWWFHPSDRRFFGLRLTHQPSPWIADYGNFLIKAYMPSDPKDKTASRDGFTGYSPQHSTFSPQYFKTSLNTYGNSKGRVQLEFTPSSHGGIMRASFPPFVQHESGDSAAAAEPQLRRVSIQLPLNADVSEIIQSPIDGTTMLAGYTKHNSGGVGGSDSAFAHYFVATIYKGKTGDKPTDFSSANTQSGKNLVFVDFAPEDADTETLTVRIATSLISRDQAIQNLKWEVHDKSFESLLTEASDEWESVLGRARVTDAPSGYSECQLHDLYTVFYSSMYRASLFPRQLTELSADGTPVHWSPYASSPDARVSQGPLSTDSGFWDAWNTVYPLMTLLNRPVLGEMTQGWVNAYSEGGWLPKWASPGYRGSMIGTMGDVSLADAIVKDIPGFDVQKAYEAIRKDAFEVPPQGVDGVGRVCLSSYLQYGYVPRGAPMTTGGTCYEVVSRTLNYLQSDWAVAQAARKLGRIDDFNVLSARASNFSLSFDQETGFFRSHSLSGKWSEPFDQFAWGDDYTESGPWQYRFYLPYDVEGLKALYAEGGRDMCAVLQEAQTGSPESSMVHIGGYGSVIHEQTELNDHCWGQYAHNNQPAHHMLYMHLSGGYASECSQQGRYWLRKTLTELYSSGADMFPGDEDNGEMAAWFVLSSLGLYTRSPGSTTFELGVPLFGAVEVDISDIQHRAKAVPTPTAYTAGSTAKTLRIEARNNSLKNTRVEKVLWNGKEISSSADSIEYELLAQGGTLTFVMA